MASSYAGLDYRLDTDHLAVPERLFDGKRHILIGGMCHPGGNPVAGGTVCVTHHGSRRGETITKIV